MNFTFATKQEYLTYKEDWKNRYIETIKSIRAAAVTKRNAARVFTPVSLTEERYRKDSAWTSLQSATSSHAVLKAQATDLLLERAYSKIQAGEQSASRLNKIS